MPITLPDWSDKPTLRVICSNCKKEEYVDPIHWGRVAYWSKCCKAKLVIEEKKSE